MSLKLAIELACFALVALLPILPYLETLIVDGVPRYHVYTDFALMEHEIRHVWTGDTLLGLGSRFRWHHPGPLLFYLCAPFERIWRPTSTGFYLATWLIAAFAAAAPVVATRRYAGRPHALAVLAVFVAWFAAFGNLAANPWVRTVVVLPLLGYFVLMALLARGATRCLLPAALLGMVVAQTHVASVSTVGAVGVAAVISFFLVARRRGGMTRNDWRWIAITAGVVVLAFSPIVVEELGPGDGNISKLLTFAEQRTEPFRPWSVAFKNWALATSWLPDRLVSMSLLHEPGVPEPMRWDPVPVGISRTATTILGLQAVITALALVVAVRRRDKTSLTFMGLGALGSLCAMSALRAIVGEEHYSLIFWTIVPGTMVWTGIASTFASALGARVERWRQRPAVTPALLGLGLALALASAAFNRSWLGRYPGAPGTMPDMAPTLRGILGAVETRLAKDDAVPVIHMMGEWGWATATVLELERDGVDVRIADNDAWSYAGAKTAAGAPRVVHLWFESPGNPLPLAPCLELLVRYGDLRTFASSKDVLQCPAPDANRDR